MSVFSHVHFATFDLGFRLASLSWLGPRWSSCLTDMLGTDLVDRSASRTCSTEPSWSFRLADLIDRETLVSKKIHMLYLGYFVPKYPTLSIL
jgi:hypothetical protein